MVTIVSIPYGKGKDRKVAITSTYSNVSIPYGKGKAKDITLVNFENL